MADEDPIKKLLLQTGWSYLEVLKKLEAYKDEFSSDSESKTADKKLNKESESDVNNAGCVKLSVNNNESGISSNTKEQCVTLENNSNEVENKDEELKNSSKIENIEPGINKIIHVETKSDKEKCAKSDKTKELSDKECETGKQNGNDSTDCKKGNSSDSKNKLNTPLESPGSQASKDAELQNIIQRLEKFIEENEESGNEELYAKKSEYGNNEEISSENSRSDKEDVMKESEKIEKQNINSTENGKEILENIPESRNERKAEENRSSKSLEEVREKTDCVEKELIKETEKPLQSKEINIENSKENKVNVVLIEKIVKENTDPETRKEELAKNSLEVKRIVENSNNTELEAKQNSEKSIEVNFEPKSSEERTAEKVEENFEVKEHTEYSKPIAEENTEMTNAALDISESRKKIVQSSQEYNIVELNTESESKKESEVNDESDLQNNLESKSNEEEKLEFATNTPENEENKLENTVESLENTNSGGVSKENLEFESNEEETVEAIRTSLDKEKEDKSKEANNAVKDNLESKTNEKEDKLEILTNPPNLKDNEEEKLENRVENVEKTESDNILQNNLKSRTTEDVTNFPNLRKNEEKEIESVENTKSDGAVKDNVETSKEELENTESHKILNSSSEEQDLEVTNYPDLTKTEEDEPKNCVDGLEHKEKNNSNKNDLDSESNEEEKIEVIRNSPDLKDNKDEHSTENAESETGKEEKSKTEGSSVDLQDNKDGKLESLEEIFIGTENHEQLNFELKNISEESINANDVTKSTKESHDNQDVPLNIFKTPSETQNILEGVQFSRTSSRRQTQSKKVTSKNLKRNLSNIRLSIIRKSKSTLMRKAKKTSENSPKVNIETEDIRSKLKEQLELLRTKRKTTELPLVSTKPSFTNLKFPIRNANRLNSITHILSQKLGNSHSKIFTDEPESDSEVKDDVFANSEHENLQQSENGTVVLSNETNLMIVNVIGGYTSPPPESNFEDNSVDIETNSETSESLTNKNNEEKDLLNGITPTKTTDVTKIKGWKNKKFAIANQSKPSDKLLFQLMNDNSELSNQSNNSNQDDQTEVQKSPPKPSILEKPENTNQTKSAFISDELDQYLTENAELNISYEVPKLEAEQTITTKYIDIKFPELPRQNPPRAYTKNKHYYKPKTLAEKRKMLANAEKPEVKDFLVAMSTRERKNYQESVFHMRKKLIEEDVPFTRRCFMTSTSITNHHKYVMYNGKKLKVPSIGQKEVIARIKDRRKVYKSLDSPPSLKVARQRKPSLLSELKSDTNKFVYNSDEWESVQVKLPKLLLKIRPQIGKRIHPKLEHLIQRQNNILTANRVEFALSTLKINNLSRKPKAFTFPIPYNKNQTHVTMRKRCPRTMGISAGTEKPIETDNEINKTVSDMVNQMLDYIETSEETKDIIQEENNPEIDVQSDLNQIENSAEKKWKKRKRKAYTEPGFHRTTLEMKRLNCKIVSFSLDEENNENDVCNKEFCKLGCVCSSIECSSANLLANHCGLSECMFKCKCKSKNKGQGDQYSLPVGTRVFSEGMINRIQDEAKKNLAKVEKEFTQTVIQTNNQIIMVGDSKERRRRATKMPKKYIDFVEEQKDHSDTSESEDEIPESKYRSITERSPTEPSLIELPLAESPEPFISTPVPKAGEIRDITNCFVKLVKYDFSDIMPFCLVHSLYKCHCKNKAVYDNSPTDKNIVACTYVTPPKPQRIKQKFDPFNREMHSSRTRGLSTSYYLTRNNSASHKNKLEKSASKFQRELQRYLLKNATKIMQGTDETGAKAVSKPCKKSTVVKESKSRRKQSMIVLEDHGSDAPKSTSSEQLIGNDAEKELKLQRRKTKPNVKGGQEIAPLSKLVIESSESTILEDTNKLKSEFLALLGNRTSQLRLYPWAALTTRFQNGTYEIWHTDGPKAVLAITEAGKRPTSRHYNIKMFANDENKSSIPSNIIRWLVTNTVPFEKPIDDILVVLAFNKFYWEICGVCEKNKSNTKSKDHVSMSLIQNWNAPEENENSTTITDTEPPTLDATEDDVDKNSSESDQPIPDETEAMIVHENLQENKKVMYCSKRRFQPKRLISDEIDDESLKVRQVLWAPVPSVNTACKWRVIYMNVTFAFLSLSRSSYTIKYDDIMKAINIGHKDKITVVLKSEELQRNYPHRKFGIYCVHNYKDKIFVGPYYPNENHDLDTLSYVSGNLINTSVLDQIKGKDSGGGRWFHQATNCDEKKWDDDIMIIPEPSPVVDLTCESEDESSNGSKTDKSNFDTATAKDRAALLKSMLATPLVNAESEVEVAKAEKALDTLLRKGHVDVNKMLVQLESLKAGSTIDTPSQSGNNTPAKIIENLDASVEDDDDRLVIDEGLTDTQVSEDEIAVKNNSNKEVGDGQVTKYLLANVPELGYILAYQHVTTKIIDVICPITKKMKQFTTPEAAISALERVFANKFIRVPPTFKLQFKMLDTLEQSSDAPLDRSVLQGYHIVGTFGVRNLLKCTATELENFGLDKAQISHMWNLFEKKLLWVPLLQLAKLLAMPVKESAMEASLSHILDKAIIEIATLQKNSTLCIKEKIDLESKKVSLAEKCSKLQYQLPPHLRSIAQEKLDQIVNFSTRQTGSQNKISEPIILDDDDDDEKEDNETPKKEVAVPKSTTKPIPALLSYPVKKTPVAVCKGTSLLSGKKVQMQNHAKSRLPQQLLSPQKDDRVVMMQRKRDASGCFVSNSNTIDKNWRTLQIAQSPSEKKLLVKEIAVKVTKDMVKIANNPLQQQKNPVVLHHGTLGNIIRTYPSTNIMNKPTIAKVTKINTLIPTTMVDSNTSKHVVVSQAKTIAVTGIPVGGPTRTNTMATLTPISLPTEFVLKNSSAKNTPNYIAIKEGNSLKYFQLVKEQKAAVLQSVQARMLPTSSIRIQPPLTRITPASHGSLLTNQKTDN